MKCKVVFSEHDSTGEYSSIADCLFYVLNSTYEDSPFRPTIEMLDFKYLGFNEFLIVIGDTILGKLILLEDK